MRAKLLHFWGWVCLVLGLTCSVTMSFWPHPDRVFSASLAWYVISFVLRVGGWVIETVNPIRTGQTETDYRESWRP